MASVVKSTGATSPTTSGEINSDFANGDNVFTSNNSRATSEATADKLDVDDFGFSISSGDNILSIDVSVEALSSFSTGDLDVDLSWDGGTSWTSAQRLNNFNSSDETLTATGLWGRTWTDAELADGSFHVRVENVSGSFDVDVDHISVDITYLDLSGKTTVFHDTFTEGSDTALSSHTPDTGTGWTEVETVGTGGIEVVASIDEVRGTASLSDGSSYKVDDDTTDADYTVLATVPTSDDNTDPLYLFGRMDATPDFYAVEMDAGSTDETRLYKRIGGTWTDMASSATVIASGDIVELEMVGTALTVYINGSSIISHTDSALTAKGRGGLGIGAARVSNDDQSNQTFDDFYIVETTATTGISDRLLRGSGD